MKWLNRADAFIARVGGRRCPMPHEQELGVDPGLGYELAVFVFGAA